MGKDLELLGQPAVEIGFHLREMIVGQVLLHITRDHAGRGYDWGWRFLLVVCFFEPMYVVFSQVHVQLISRWERLTAFLTRPVGASRLLHWNDGLPQAGFILRLSITSVCQSAIDTMLARQLVQLMSSG